ncbi:MAG: hypothetical protein HDT36_04450 [Clostridiales bacterium]|nr:hypothetical protein [Clostridiales bacterium]
MQKQKTIAKWLAIILLLTIIVTCYFVFRAVIQGGNSSNKDIAGADDSGNNTTVTPPLEDIVDPPVYSEFPRNAEIVGGVTVRHVGGENKERLLDTMYFGGKRLVFFASESTQYDVRESGIHIAVFDSDKLSKTVKVAGADEEFKTVGLVQNGLLIVTTTDSNTKLRLYDNGCNMIAENSCPKFSSYKLYLSGTAATLFATDSSYIYAMSISRTLDATRSNFVYPLDGGMLLYAMKFGTENTVIVQTKNDVGILTYSTTSGFSFKTQLINCQFEQLLPVVSSGKQALILSCATDDGIQLSSINTNCTVTESYLLKGEHSAVCLPQDDNNNIAVLAGTKQYTFCSHLELQSTTGLNMDENIYASLGTVNTDDITYQAVNGETNTFIMTSGSTFSIVSVENGNVRHVFSAIGTSVRLVREPQMLGNSALSILFNASSVNSFSYMCFGDDDVFYLTLTSLLTAEAI